LPHFATAAAAVEPGIVMARRYIQSYMERSLMKKTVCLIALLLLAAPFAFAGDQDFTLVNETGLVIDQLYCSPSESKDWEEDILGTEVLEDGEKAEITFSRDETARNWDLMIVDEDGDKVVWDEIDLLEAESITLYYENGRPTAKIMTAEEDEDDSAGDADTDDDSEDED
jgi:hypothetical protein